MKPAEASKLRTWILPPAPYAAALLLGWWLDRHVLRMTLDLGALSEPLGWGMSALGLIMLGWTLATLHQHRTTVNPYKSASSLCTRGPFRISRNPIYVGDGILLVAVAILLRTAWPFAFAPIVWVTLRYGVIRHEEMHLEERFGDAYRRYKAEVRRWL